MLRIGAWPAEAGFFRPSRRGEAHGSCAIEFPGISTLFEDEEAGDTHMAMYRAVRRQRRGIGPRFAGTMAAARSMRHTYSLDKRSF